MFYYQWIAISMLIFPSLALAFDWFQNSAQQAERAFNQGHYSQAAELFTDPYQKGVALYRAGQYAEAAQAFAAPQREEVKTDALYGLGNAYFRQSRFQEAIHAYESVLAQQPHYEDAKQNLALAKQRMSTSNSSSQSQNSPQEKGNQNAQNGQNSDSNNNPKPNQNPLQNAQNRQNSDSNNNSKPNQNLLQNAQNGQNSNFNNNPKLNQNPSPQDSHSLSQTNADSQANPSSPTPVGQNDSRPLETQVPTPSQATRPEKTDNTNNNAQPSSLNMATQSQKNEGHDPLPSNVNMAKDGKNTQPPTASEKNLAISQDKMAGKSSDSSQKVSTVIGSSQEKPVTEADLMANALLDRIDQGPRQLLQKQFFIDAYNAKQEKQIPEKSW